jgi:hypothetical protein
MVEETRRTVEEAGIEKPIGALGADAGYWRDDLDVAAIEKEGPELVIATKKAHKQRKACKTERAPKGRIPKTPPHGRGWSESSRPGNGRETYQLRTKTVEPVFGQIKRNFEFLGSCAGGCEPRKASGRSCAPAST